jgi:hypothetical protein
MSTADDPARRKKHITTYGKSVRKLGPGYLGSRVTMRETGHDHVAENRLLRDKPIQDSPVISSDAQNAPGSASLSRTPTTASIFEFPSSDIQEEVISPNKRRKLPDINRALPKRAKRNSPAVAIKGGSQSSSEQKGTIVSYTSQAIHNASQSHESRRKQDGDKYEPLLSKDGISRPQEPGLLKRSQSSSEVPIKKLTKAVSRAKRSTEQVIPPTIKQKTKYMKTTKPTIEIPLIDSRPSQLSTPNKRFDYAAPDDTGSQDVSHSDGSSTVLTPKGIKMWNGLLGEADDEMHSDGVEDVVQNNREASVQARPAKKKLIDSLFHESKVSRRAEQVSDFEEDKTCSIKQNMPRQKGQQAEPAIEPDMEGPTAGLGVGQKSAGVVIQPGGPKITYSQQRSMLKEDIMERIPYGLPRQRNLEINNSRQNRGIVPKLSQAYSLLDDDGIDDAASGGAIRTVHELRQAGANTRFMDEIEDLMERITMKSPSMRRSGLLDLSEKMHEKDFSRRFISHGLEQRFVHGLGNENDIICGFLAISVLIVILDSGFSPTAVSQLESGGVSQLLGRLIGMKTDITSIAKDRKANMSKAAHMLISEQKQRLLALTLWGEVKPKTLSPCTTALGCLQLVARQNRELGTFGDLFTKNIMAQLFGIVELALSLGSWERAKDSGGLDFSLALSILESQSLRVISISQNTWPDNHLPIIRDLLHVSLTASHTDSDPLSILALQLTINVTNNNSKASDIFATPDLMASMIHAIILKFNLLSEHLVEHESLTIVDHLILMLGVMINLAEWSVLARECVQSLENKSLDDAVHIFLQNFKRASEVCASHLPLFFTKRNTDALGRFR